MKKNKSFKYRESTFLGRILWSIVGLALLPVLVLVFLATVMLLGQIPVFSATVLEIFCGILLYSFFHFFVYQPVALYVMSHEFTHAVFALFSGYRVKKIKISTKGGYVEMSESNFLIDLAPYFFPLYTIVFTAVFYGLDKLFQLDKYYWLFFIGFGILISFHVLSNWDVLKIEQPDMNSVGKVFGIIFVLIVNLLIINILLAVIFAHDINLNIVVTNFIEAGKFVFGLLTN